MFRPQVLHRIIEKLGSLDGWIPFSFRNENTSSVYADLSMSILSGNEIQMQIANGDIVIEPFEPDRVNPVSVDLTLGDEVAVYEDFTYCGSADEWEGNCNVPYDGTGLTPNSRALPLDTKKKSPLLRKWKMYPEVGWVLVPGVCYLLHTAESVFTKKFVPVLDGKSSIGRLFVQVHKTAAFGDPGFHGQYTLEVTSRFPVKIYPGMRICQVRFHLIKGLVDLYDGHYKDSYARGPVGSRVAESSFDD